MKIQDIILFLLIIILLVFLRKPRLFAALGLVLLVLAIPLFAMQIFFTAQRLVYFSVLSLFIAVILELFRTRHDE